MYIHVDVWFNWSYRLQILHVRLKVLQRISHTNHPLAIWTSPCSQAPFIIVRALAAAPNAEMFILRRPVLLKGLAKRCFPGTWTFDHLQQRGTGRLAKAVDSFWPENPKTSELQQQLRYFDLESLKPTICGGNKVSYSYKNNTVIIGKLLSVGLTCMVWMLNDAEEPKLEPSPMPEGTICPTGGIRAKAYDQL